MTKDPRLNDLYPLFDNQKLAVLSTQNQGRPYASLVAFSFSRDLKELFFLTSGQTRKFANLLACPEVALLVHSATNLEADFATAQAVTALGRATPLADKAAQLKTFLVRHPSLASFARDKETVMVAVAVSTYIKVSRFEEVVEIKV